MPLTGSEIIYKLIISQFVMQSVQLVLASHLPESAVLMPRQLGMPVTLPQTEGGLLFL